MLAVKSRRNFDDNKEVYAFSLGNKDTGKEALFTVKISDPVFKDVEGRPKQIFNPGAIEIHPITGKYYILDGSNPKLLITGQDGSSEQLIMLTPKEFGNPEGLTFSSRGDMYISNEAEGARGNILKVTLK